MGADTLNAGRAALLLHSLPPKVRERVLTRLSVGEASRVDSLLAELRAIGAPESLGAHFAHLAKTAASLPPPTLEERVTALRADDVLQCLQSRDAATIAHLLRAREWPWKSQLLGLLPANRRAEVSSLLQKLPQPLGPAALAVLCEQLDQEAAGQAARRRQAKPVEAASARFPGRKLSRWFRWTR